METVRNLEKFPCMGAIPRPYLRVCGEPDWPCKSPLDALRISSRG